MWHEGQFEGWRVRLPVFLGRRPAEPVDEELRRFHLGLIARRRRGARGDWDAVRRERLAGRLQLTQLLAWSWIDDEQRSLIVINFADAPAAARRVHPPWNDLAGRTWRLDDLLSDRVFVRDGTEIATDGLYVQLAPWEFHVLAWTRPAWASTPDHRRSARAPTPTCTPGRACITRAADVGTTLGPRHLADASYHREVRQ